MHISAVRATYHAPLNLHILDKAVLTLKMSLSVSVQPAVASSCSDASDHLTIYITTPSMHAPSAGCKSSCHSEKRRFKYFYQKQHQQLFYTGIATILYRCMSFNAILQLRKSKCSTLEQTIVQFQTTHILSH
jgi:hypothetical protein